MAHRDAAPGPSHHDLSAIQRLQERPHDLIVDGGEIEDNSVAYLSQTTMGRISIFRGDTLVIRGKRRRDTVLICLSSDDVKEGHIRMNSVARKNIHVKRGDLVHVQRSVDIAYGKRVHILPFKDSIEGLGDNVFDTYLKPYFLEAYRPVRMGDTFVVRGENCSVEFKVIETDPAESCIVAQDTMIHSVGDPLERESDVFNPTDLDYDDIGGLRKEVTQLRELVELPLSHVQLFLSLGVRPPRGVLISGPSGSGKSLIVRAVANETGAFFFLLNGPELLRRSPFDAERDLREAFEAAKKNAPAIILIDRIEAIASAQGSAAATGVCSQLLGLMDDLLPRSNLVVVGVTSRPNSLDPALRCFGRFDQEIRMGAPDATGRYEILRIHTKKMKLADDVDLEQIAVDTDGYVGADIAGLCFKAAMSQIRLHMDLVNLNSPDIDPELLELLRVEMDDFRFALSGPSHHDRSTIPSLKRRFNDLIVDEAEWDDNSVAYLNQTTMDRISAYRGDTYLIRGKRHRDTALIIMNSDDVKDGHIQMNSVVRKNLHVRPGDLVNVQQFLDIQYGKRVHIRPFKDSIEGLSGNIFDLYLKPYFLEAYRPVRKGDTFVVRGELRTAEFKVMETDPAELCIIAQDTIIHRGRRPRAGIRRFNPAHVGYDDIGGCNKQISQIRELVELPLSHVQLFLSLGVSPPRGVLISGPSGTGKSLLVRAVANETSAFFFLLNGPELLRRSSFDAERDLNKAFEAAKKNAPAIILIEHFDAIASSHGSAAAAGVLSQLLVLMDDLLPSSNLVVVGATSRPNSLDPALRRFGRFDQEIRMGNPDVTGRLEILRIQCKRMKLADDVDLQEIAEETHGYVGADLAALCFEAAMQQIRMHMHLVDLNRPDVDPELLELLQVEMDDFRAALSSRRNRIQS